MVKRMEEASAMQQAPDSEGTARIPPELRWLKWLVIALAAVMIAGFLVLIAALVIRLNQNPLPLPDRISIPDGANPRAFTQGDDWFAVVTDDDRILIYDRDSAALVQSVDIAPAD